MNFKLIHPFFLLLFFYHFLLEKDPRLKELNEVQRNTNKNMRLYFQGINNNFIIFYDYSGRLIYLKYKQDKWDYSKDKIISRLQPGIVYFVSFTYMGKTNSKINTQANTLNSIFNSKEYNPLVDNTDKKIRNKDDIYLGILIEAKSSLDEYYLRY